MPLRSRPIHFLALALPLVAVAAARAVDDAAADLRVGRTVADFTLPAADGSTIALHDLAGKKAAVLVFAGTQCPVGNLYLPRLAELARTFEPQGVAFLAINSNASESMADVAAHAREHAIPFPVLKDARNAVADLVGAERTCEVLVLDGRARVAYRGAIDDQYGQGTRKPEPAAHYLRDALAAVVAGRPVAVASTPVAGCPIERVDAPAAVAGARPARVRPASATILDAIAASDAGVAPRPDHPVTYAGDVAAILRDKCQACHRPGQVGPFSLLGYDDARRWATSIAEVVDNRRMPPWHADPRFGHFRNDRSLTPPQRAALLAWVEAGAPLGDPTRIPPPRSFPAAWSIGVPDLVVELPKPIEIPSHGVLDYINVAVPSGFDADRWVQAAEILPSERSVVHHVIAYVETRDAKGKKHKDHLAAYVPGDVPTVYPAGVAKKIPAGATLSFEIHYTPDGTPRTDQTRLALIFATGPVEHEAHTRFILNTKFRIPPGAAAHEVTSTWTIPRPIHLISLSPHMHLRGKDFKYTATFPDGRTEVLLSVPAYDFGWQSVYVLDQPRALPPGTRIDCLAHFDNSAGNPNNPDPTKEIGWGEQSFQEMMMGYLDYSDDEAPAAKP